MVFIWDLYVIDMLLKGSGGDRQVVGKGWGDVGG